MRLPLGIRNFNHKLSRGFPTSHHDSNRHRIQHHCRSSKEALSTTADIKDLRQALQDAIASEDYQRAAELRDAIALVEAQDPIQFIKSQLQLAIRDENYSLAATLRDQLEQLAPPLSTTAVAITDGVKVHVTSSFIPTQSSPQRGQYLFSYQITITNDSNKNAVKLMNRHWKIIDAEESMQEVRGSGVIGENPVLTLGQSFSYTSYCPLPTPTGTMEGEYEFYVVTTDSAGKETYSASFLVDIPRFALVSGERL
jgi:ApaG protein